MSKHVYQAKMSTTVNISASDDVTFDTQELAQRWIMQKKDAVLANPAHYGPLDSVDFEIVPQEVMTTLK